MMCGSPGMLDELRQMFEAPGIQGVWNRVAIDAHGEESGGQVARGVDQATPRTDDDAGVTS
jgi:NAD(P)H-flavin reductase